MEEVDGFVESASEALELLDDLRRTGDTASFVQNMRKWAVKPGTLAFNGHSGQKMLHQLEDRANSPRDLATLLGDALDTPSSDDEAASKIQAVVGYVETIKVKGHPAPGHVPFLLSYFWSLADQRNWSVIWRSAAAFAEFLGGDDLPQSGAEKYRSYMQRIREVAADVAEFEITAKWWDDQKGRDWPEYRAEEPMVVWPCSAGHPSCPLSRLPHNGWSRFGSRRSSRPIGQSDRVCLRTVG